MTSHSGEDQTAMTQNGNGMSVAGRSASSGTPEHAVSSMNVSALILRPPELEVSYEITGQPG